MCIEHNKQMVSKLCLRRKTPNWLMFPQVVLVGSNLLMFLLIRHLRMLLDNSFQKHLEENLQRDTEGKISISERRVLVTKWVGKAWTEVGSNRDTVVRSFKKCGISLSVHGSKTGEIHIESIEEYQLPTANEITEFELDSESEIEDDEDN